MSPDVQREAQWFSLCLLPQSWHWALLSLAPSPRTLHTDKVP